MTELLTKIKFKDSYKLQTFAEKSINKLGLRFPIKPSIDLAKIVSFLTFDGHLTENCKVFIFTSGKKSELQQPENWVNHEFGLDGKIRKVSSNEYGRSYALFYISQPISRILHLIGTPNGKKVAKIFLVPEWIKNSRKFSRTYLKVAFDCEGSIWRESKNKVKIRFSMHKSPDLIENGIEFLEQLKEMLLKLHIETSNIWTGKSGNTIYIRFNISSSSLIKFKEEIGFSSSRKKSLLEGVAQLGTS